MSIFVYEHSLVVVHYVHVIRAVLWVDVMVLGIRMRASVGTIQTAWTLLQVSVVMSLSCASVVFVLVCSLPLVANGWWPFSSEVSSESAQLPAEQAPERSKKPAQFEMMSAEQKFLSEAQQFLDLSPLDQCLHGVSEKWNTKLQS